MKTKQSLALIILIIIFGAGSFWIYQSQKGAGLSAEKAIYYCPMHPTYTSDRPGDCPICNMKLVKKEIGKDEETAAHEHAGHNVSAEGPREFTIEQLLKMKPGEICLLHKCKMGTCMIAMTEEAARAGKCPHCKEDLGIIIKDLMPAGYAKVKLTPEKQQLIGIKTAQAQKVSAAKDIRTVGKIAYDPELYQAQEELVQAVQSFKKAETGNIQEIKEQAGKLVESARLKLKLMGLSNDLIREIETAGQADKSLLFSEGGGTVWLYAPIYEYEIPYVKTGQSVEVEAAAISGKKFKGTIRSIDTVLDPMTRSNRIRAVLDNTEGFLKPEMYVNVNLGIDLGNVLVVPEEAVFATGDHNILFVAKQDGSFEPREVVLGPKSESGQVIQSGVGEGESVVVSGNFLIDSESRLKAALAGMGSGQTHQHGG